MKHSKAVIISIILVIICLGTACFIIVKNSNIDSVMSTSSIPSPEPTPTVTPEPTPEPTPDVSPLDASWFDDAVFFGDSISVALGKYCAKSGDLGNALFLCEGSYSIHNAINGKIKIWYKGQELSAEDALSLTSATKCFICLGVNDIALYGVPDTMEYWNMELNTLKEKNPNVQFFIESCTPIYGEAQYDKWNNTLIDEYNLLLKEMCNDRGFIYVDISSYLKNEENDLALCYTTDKYCHINYSGTAVWAEQLKNVENYSVNPRSIIYEIS